MSSPRLTVILPVYNGERFLSEAIESILGQTFSNFDLLIINDGSTDRSAEIIEKYRSSDQRVHTIQQENQGLIETLNRGLKWAQSPYIARQDADDLSHPERLARQIEFLDRHPDHALVGTTFVVRTTGEPDRIFPIPIAHEQIVEGFFHGNRFAHGSVMFRREAFLQAGAYRNLPETQHIEDFDAWVRLAQMYLVANLSETLYIYRDHPEGISNRKRAIQDQNRDRLIAQLREPACFTALRKTPGYRRVRLGYFSLRDPIRHERSRDTAQFLMANSRLMKAQGRVLDAWRLWFAARVLRIARIL